MEQVAQQQPQELSQAEINQKIEQVEGQLLQMPQVECPITNRFAPHCYAREISMPAGSIIIGHKHKTKHFNVILTGKASVMMDGEVVHIEAPDVFVSEPGVRKVLYIREDMRWMTIHPTEETDLDKLEEEIVEHSETYDEHYQDLLSKDLETLQEQINEEET